MKSRSGSILFATLFFLTSLTAGAASADFTATQFRYGNRILNSIDFYGAGDRIRFAADATDGSLVWLENTAAGPKVMSVPPGDPGWNESAKRLLGDIGKRSFWSPLNIPAHNAVYFIGDEGHDETFNIYKVDTTDGTLSKITSGQYLASFGVSVEAGIYVYAARKNKFLENSCLEELGFTAAAPKELFCDTDEWKHYLYEHPFVSPDGRYIATTVMAGLNRSRLNLMIFDRQTGSARVVTDPQVARGKLMPLGFIGESAIYIANEGPDAEALWAVPVAGGAPEKIIDNDMTTMSGAWLAAEGYFLLHKSGGGKSKLEVVRAADRTVLASAEASNVLFWYNRLQKAGASRYAIAGSDSATKQLVAFLIDLTPSALASGNIVSVGFQPAASSQRAAPCASEDISYPTFDQDPATGTTRMIRAVLYKPEIAAKQTAGFVYAHGGPSYHVSKDDYIAEIEVLCKLGYTVVAANVRGSTGQGQAFMDLNNKDWGGGDYMDYEYARRYMESEMGIPARRIGIIGSSFGGYMTNWAMTRPDNKFAAGISIYGSADLDYKVRNTVVPANQISDMGHPDDFPDLYRERSPMFYVDSMNAPLFLTHGANDFRTPTQDTRNFFSRLNEAGKNVEYLELPGEGHGYLYLDSNTAFFRRMADFLWRHVPLAE